MAPASTTRGRDVSRNRDHLFSVQSVITREKSRNAYINDVASYLFILEVEKNRRVKTKIAVFERQKEEKKNTRVKDPVTVVILVNTVETVARYQKGVELGVFSGHLR